MSGVDRSRDLAAVAAVWARVHACVPACALADPHPVHNPSAVDAVVAAADAVAVVRHAAASAAAVAAAGTADSGYRGETSCRQYRRRAGAATRRRRWSMPLGPPPPRCSWPRSPSPS